jgi:hypothetical protein
VCWWEVAGPCGFPLVTDPPPYSRLLGFWVPGSGPLRPLNPLEGFRTSSFHNWQSKPTSTHGQLARTASWPFCARISMKWRREITKAQTEHLTKGAARELLLYAGDHIGPSMVTKVSAWAADHSAIFGSLPCHDAPAVARTRVYTLLQTFVSS